MSESSVDIQTGSCGTQISTHPHIWRSSHGEAEQNIQAALLL